MAMGGTASEALDHLLATKVFRRGKVTGRYDTRNEKIEAILFNLEKIWEELGLLNHQKQLGIITTRYRKIKR
jgi:tRNA A58 N-methylase Trm61